VKPAVNGLAVDGQPPAIGFDGGDNVVGGLTADSRLLVVFF
jgi:hypothetical protein